MHNVFLVNHLIYMLGEIVISLIKLSVSHLLMVVANFVKKDILVVVKLVCMEYLLINIVRYTANQIAPNAILDFT